MNIYNAILFTSLLLTCTDGSVLAAGQLPINVRTALGHIHAGQHEPLRKHITECVYATSINDIDDDNLFCHMIHVKDKETTYEMNLIDYCAYHGKTEALKIIQQALKPTTINKLRHDDDHPSIITKLLDCKHLSAKRLKTIKYMITNMEEVDIKTACNKYGSTPLMWTAFCLARTNITDEIHALLCEIVKKLIAKKVDMLVVSNQSNTALSFLLEARHACNQHAKKSKKSNHSKNSTRIESIEALIKKIIKNTADKNTSKSKAINQRVKVDQDEYPLFLSLFSHQQYSSVLYLIEHYKQYINFEATTQKGSTVRGWIKYYTKKDPNLKEDSNFQKRRKNALKIVKLLSFTKDQHHFLAERPFECSFCYKKFAKKRMYKQHLTHHPLQSKKRVGLKHQDNIIRVKH